MADSNSRLNVKKIKELPEVEYSSLSDTDWMIQDDESVTHKFSLSNLIQYIKNHNIISDFFVHQSSVGNKNGVASLDENTKVPLAQLYEASTSAKGITQLTDSTSSTSITTAATPNSVKKVNDSVVTEKKRATDAEEALTTAISSEVTRATAAENALESTVSTKAPLASPTLTGTPKAPTASAGTNTTQIATTAFVQTAVSNHNTSTTAHSDIRELISNLTTRLNALADSDDTTLDQLSEIVAYIKSNRTLIENVTTNKVNVSDIVDNLTSTSSNKPLSANQGKVLKDLIDELESSLNTRVVSTVADQGLSDTQKSNARTNIGLNNAIISGSQTTTSTADGGSNVYTFTDASGATSTITVKNGSKGSTGATGTGVTISSTSVTYQASSSGTTTPTGTWSTSIPSTSAGQYLWTKTVVTYSDGKSTTAYSVSRNGNDGSAGGTGTAGAAGIGISKVEQTTTSTVDGGTNICTVTLTDDSTYTFSFKNGNKGSDGVSGKDGTNGTSAEWFAGTAVTGTSTTAVSASVSGSKSGDMYLNTSTCNVYRASAANSWVYVCNIKGATGSTGATGATGATGQRGSRWSSGTAITGTSTTGTVFSGTGITDALVNDMYLNTSTGNTYRCTIAGAASAAKWVYTGNIKGAKGDSGEGNKYTLIEGAIDGCYYCVGSISNEEYSDPNWTSYVTLAVYDTYGFVGLLNFGTGWYTDATPIDTICQWVILPKRSVGMNFTKENFYIVEYSRKIELWVAYNGGDDGSYGVKFQVVNGFNNALPNGTIFETKQLVSGDGQIKLPVVGADDCLYVGTSVICTLQA